MISITLLRVCTPSFLDRLLVLVRVLPMPLESSATVQPAVHLCLVKSVARRPLFVEYVAKGVHVRLIHRQSRLRQGWHPDRHGTRVRDHQKGRQIDAWIVLFFVVQGK